MQSHTYNRLSARKILGAINHLIAGEHQPIEPVILRRLIAAHVRELFEILPRSAGGLVATLDAMNHEGKADTAAFASHVAALLASIPVTYGMLPAGQRFTIANSDTVFTKRKGGVQGSVSHHPHPRADLPVTPL